jgi:hypothetical protein
LSFCTTRRNDPVDIIHEKSTIDRRLFARCQDQMLTNLHASLLQPRANKSDRFEMWARMGWNRVHQARLDVILVNSEWQTRIMSDGNRYDSIISRDKRHLCAICASS